MTVGLKIYGKQNCLFCQEAISLAKRYEIKYEYVDVGYKQHLEEMKSLVPDATTVPQIFWHGRYIGGYKELVSEIENTLGDYAQGMF